MSDTRDVLVSEGRHATAFHRELGNSKLARCGKNAQHDREFVRVSLQEAIEEYDREPCPQCSIPDDWVAIDTGEGMVADGGHLEATLTVARDDDRLSALVDGDGFAVLGTVDRDTSPEDVKSILNEVERELRALTEREPTRRSVRADGGDQR